MMQDIGKCMRNDCKRVDVDNSSKNNEGSVVNRNVEFMRFKPITLLDENSSNDIEIKRPEKKNENF